ncbi:MAG: endonuclease/exonuclease/phosphatase family protein [Prevotella sp.]|nr:endonuclease/exonuclease/phosphatase family protein [Prevotella sp.]
MCGLLSFFFYADMYAQEQLKVVTFNVRSFEPDFNVQPFADCLMPENADIICLNEVENRSARQMVNMKYRDVVQDMASKLNMFGVFGYAYNLMNKKGDDDETKYTYCENELYGNAILSRYPIVNVQALRLPRPEGSADQRGVVVADILLPSGRMVRVACSHLDHIGGQMEQARVLTGNTVISQTLPTLLTGDMNMWPGTDVINLLTQSYDRMDTDQGTYYGASKIDFILGAKGQFELVSSKVLDRFYNGQELSDHCPVVSIVKLK